MTPEEIAEGKRIIAEFTEVKIGKDLYSWRVGGTVPLQESHLAYDKEWGWIMPVCIKLKKLVDEKENFPKTGKELMEIEKALLKLDITLLFIAVVNFLKWHKRQQA